MNDMVSIPRSEHPRPDLMRADWINLNGEWAFQFDDQNVGETAGWYKDGNSVFTGRILVPYCYQSELSGVRDTGVHPYLWYRRKVKMPDYFDGKHVILHFGAVDYYAKVWVNGELAGEHRGGHTPFRVDVTRYAEDDMLTIVVRAEDRLDAFQPRGKQSWTGEPHAIWYTPTSGIWQTVWLEAVGKTCVEKIKWMPDIDNRLVKGEVYLSSWEQPVELHIQVDYQGHTARSMMVLLTERMTLFTVDLKEIHYADEVHYWTPEHPNLYDSALTLILDGREIDRVQTYFGMRKIAVENGRIMLNNKPYYQKLVLDQGYWPESLMTPPSEQAIIDDIKWTKAFGFNGARKHQKIEDPLYYYWADKLGLLVWGEMPSGYWFTDDEIRSIYHEWFEFIERDYNHPCIVTWVPLNESWGVRNIKSDPRQQSFGMGLYHMIKALDGTRLVSTNDGWEQVHGDICGFHDYSATGADYARKFSNPERLLAGAAEYRMIYADGFAYEGQPVIITEYGGIAFANHNVKGGWGYNSGAKNADEYIERFRDVTGAIQTITLIQGYCYTQLTDVQQEVNGLLTFDRKPKLSPENIFAINRGTNK